MTKPTMKEYMMRTREDYGSGIARPKFDKDTRFELKGQFLKELREHTFSRSENEDANEHIERVHEIVDLFTTPDVTQDQLMLRVFPITLTGAARLDVPTRHILDSKGGVLKLSTADAKKAIQEMVDYSQKWHDGTSTRSKISNTSDDFPLKEEGKTLEEAYYTQFGVPFPQAGRYKAAASKFYQRDNGNTSYQERRQMMEELINKFMAESAKRHDEHSSLIKEIRALMDAAIRNQGASIKALEIQIGQMSKEDNKMPLIELSRGTIPFHGCLKENGYDEKEVLKDLKKLKVNSTESATSLRRLLKENSRIEDEIKATMKVHCSEIIKNALPLKEKDLRSFTLPCSINNMCFDKALAALGASVNVMPYSTFTNLGLCKLALTKLIIELTDKTMKRPKGRAENVLVGIGKFVFPIDFIVLDMPDDIKIPLIRGRPFLSIAHAKIDVFKRKFALRIRNDKIVFKSYSPTSNIIKKVYVLGLREQMELDFEATLMGDPKFRDFLELNDLNDLNEPLKLNDHEIEDLDPEIENGEIIDEPKVDVVKIRHDHEIIERIYEYPNFAIMEDMDAYRDKNMGDVIVRKTIL
ncbi:ribonuclease H-like domain, reverse transcriptase, RNA-dependent DNA polymerase [Tanacetum coccineum]